MSQQPVLPLFVGDYLADTQHLTMEESGTYLHLLMAMWTRDGSVPNDDRDLARIFRLRHVRWIRVKARLMPLLSIDENGNLMQKRLRKEWDRVHSGVQSRTPKPANFVHSGDTNRSQKWIKNDMSLAGSHGQNQALSSRLARGRARASQSNPIKSLNKTSGTVAARATDAPRPDPTEEERNRVAKRWDSLGAIIGRVLPEPAGVSNPVTQPIPGYSEREIAALAKTFPHVADMPARLAGLLEWCARQVPPIERENEAKKAIYGALRKEAGNIALKAERKEAQQDAAAA